MQSKKVSTHDVAHIADLAHIPVTEKEKENLSEAFTTTYGVVDILSKANTKDMTQTQQVTGLENVTREDVVDEARMFSQEEALRNATTTHNGYFVVHQVLNKS